MHPKLPLLRSTAKRSAMPEMTGRKFMGSLDISNPNEALPHERAICKVFAWYEKYGRPGEIIEIISAYKFAAAAHEGVLRDSGDPYISHPVAVCEKVKELGLPDPKMLIAALLHDIVEDTDIGIAEIKERYGKEVAILVDGLTKIPSSIKTTKDQSEMETLKKIILSLKIDPRIALLKLLDVVHNLETLGARPADRRIYFAARARSIYSKIADGLGMRAIKNRIEELCTLIISPEDHSMEVRFMAERRAAQLDDKLSIWREMSEALKELLPEGTPIGFHLTGWTPYETIKKRAAAGYPVHTASIEGEASFVVVIPNNLDPFGVYSALAGKLTLASTDLRDRIHKPKTNGYQALMFRVRGASGHVFNVQIQTSHQYKFGQEGIAHAQAHRIYGEREIEAQTRWADAIVASAQSDAAPEDIQHLARELRSSLEPIIVFDKSGKQYEVAQGSTYRDFAYRIGLRLGIAATSAQIESDGTETNLGKPVQPGQKIIFICGKKDRAVPSYKALSEVSSGRLRKLIAQLRKNYPTTCKRKGLSLLRIHLGKSPYFLTPNDLLSTASPLTPLTVKIRDRFAPIIRDIIKSSAERKSLVEDLLLLLGSGDIPPSKFMEILDEESRVLLENPTSSIQIFKLEMPDRPGIYNELTKRFGAAGINIRIWATVTNGEDGKVITEFHVDTPTLLEEAQTKNIIDLLCRKLGLKLVAPPAE